MRQAQAHGSRLVVVDDHPAAAESLAAYSRLHGHWATVVPPDGVAYMAEQVMLQQPDVVLIDICLGAQDGLELVGELRRRGCTAQLVTMSARGPDAVPAGNDTDTPDDFWPKPFAPRQLDRLLDDLARARPRLQVIA